MEWHCKRGEIQVRREIPVPVTLCLHRVWREVAHDSLPRDRPVTNHLIRVTANLPP